MRDSGLPSRQEKSKLANRMAKTVQSKLMCWTEDNFGYFEQTMEMIREGAPVQWVKLYMESVKLGLDKTTNINININRQQDRENLQALVRARIPVAIPSSSQTTAPIPEETNEEVYTPFEEINDNAHERETAATHIR